MTQQEKNQKLAEWAGYSPAPEYNCETVDKIVQCWKTPCGKRLVHRLPSYFTSLDAVHELEMKLDHIQHALFREKLCRVCCDDQGFNWRNTYSATAAQRAKALGLTLGLWEEGE